MSDENMNVKWECYVLQIELAGKCEITPASLGMESIASQFRGTVGTMMSVWYLHPSMFP